MNFARGGQEQLNLANSSLRTPVLRHAQHSPSMHNKAQACTTQSKHAQHSPSPVQAQLPIRSSNPNTAGQSVHLHGVRGGPLLHALILGVRHLQLLNPLALGGGRPPRYRGIDFSELKGGPTLLIVHAPTDLKGDF